jgi:GT2 family glycosyltransferase
MSAPRAVDRDITLLIPTLGRPILRRTLDSVLADVTWPAQIVIVDQGRKESIARVSTRFIAITDDDCEVAPDWIAGIGERLRRHGAVIVTGRVDAGEGDTQFSVVTFRVEEIQRRPALRFDRLSGGNMAMSLEVAERVGPFSEDPVMRHAEDTEYAYRALRARVPIVYAPDVAVRHLGWRDEAEWEDRYRNDARSHSAFFGRYLRQGDGSMILRTTVHVLRSLRRRRLGSLRRDPEAARRGFLHRCLATALRSIRR